MQLYWSGPGISRQLIPDAAFTTTNTATAINNLITVVKPGSLSNLVKDYRETSASPKVYPNPFVESFTIDYYNAGSVKDKVSIGICDLNGRLIYNYQPPALLPGYNRWIVNPAGSKLASGVYMAQLKVNGIPSKLLNLLN